ncbi:MAG: DEAD/DEAH box helicase family protein [archaeon]
MALHKDFPKSPHEILDPSVRWFPADEALRKEGYEKLLPPLVDKIRKDVKQWRESNYEGASETSKALLKWWFETEHPVEDSDGNISLFKYYFCQREAIESIIYLYEVAEVKDKHDLLRYDSSGAVSTGMFAETWRRFVIKMATGSGKTKVLSLVLAWSYFHKLYEEDSDLARNFLIITPNIIVLDRIRADFDSLRIFYEDPILPSNGFGGQNWQDDFQLSLHIQDDANVVRKIGNIFLTNIHRIFDSRTKTATAEDEDTTNYFLGDKPVGATNESKVDLSEIVRDVDELVILNDEAHHIHDERMAWFKSLEDIHNKLLQKGSKVSLQVDTTATPKQTNGAIFVQTISDYPLVEAIYQDVVKKPIVPDEASRAKLNEIKSSNFTEKYRDFIHLGYEEWKKVYEEHIKVNKKAVLFVMTDDTRNCDEVKDYLEKTYSDLKDAVLVIHTKNNGEISESSTGKKEAELKELRKAANEIDGIGSKYKAVVSVLMLKEGWDVKNVTTIVGLRAYSAVSNILPEQTLGRGLRRMYRGQDIEEYVSVIGTPAFMEFVESIKNEGVELEKSKMGDRTPAKTPLVVEIDQENKKKDLKKLDIEIPVLTPRVFREYKNLSELDIAKFKYKKIKVRKFSEDEKKEIIFRYVVNREESKDDIHHKTILDTNAVINFQGAVGFFTQSIMKELRLISGYDILYEKVKYFVQNELFESKVDLEDLNTLRNLSEVEATRTIIETFKKEINDLTVQDKGNAEIRNYIKLSKCRPFVVKNQGYLVPKKSVFNRIIGDSHLELRFANFLEGCEDIISYVKNYFGVHFKIDYKNADGNISDYYIDFIVKKSEKEVFIIETKGREDLDVPLKMARLKQWCEDINRVQKKVKFDFVYVDEESFDKYHPSSFEQLERNFLEYKD